MTDLDGNDITLGDLIGLSLANQALANKLIEELKASLSPEIPLPKGYRKLPKWDIRHK